MTLAHAPDDAARRLLPETLTLGVSASALFDCREADAVFRSEGAAAYADYMQARLEEPFPKGAVWPLADKLLRFTEGFERQVDVLVLTRNDALSNIRLMNSLHHHGPCFAGGGHKVLDFVMTGGRSLAPFLAPYKVDLFLSNDAMDVQDAINQGIAAAVMSPPPTSGEPDPDKLHICFDFDGVLVDTESERYWQELERQGLAFEDILHEAYARERSLMETPPAPGPFAAVLRKLSRLRGELPKDILPVEISILTARCNITLERALRTFKSWDITPDRVFSHGLRPGVSGPSARVSKAEILGVLRPDLFLDDSQRHIDLAADIAPTGKVLWPEAKAAA